MQEYVPLPIAAKSAGMPVRTLRYWVTTGKLSARKGNRGYLVRQVDVQRIRDATHREESTDANPPAPAADDTVHAPETAIVSATARAQLAAVMEEWVTPLMDRIAALERENGQLQERVLSVTRERDAAIAQRGEPAVPESASQPGTGDAPAPRKPRSFWQRLFQID